MQNDTEALKTCPVCKRELPATTEYFGSNRASRDGLSSYCRPCLKEYNRQYRQENEGRLRVQRREYYEGIKADPERREERNRKGREWKRRNKDKVLESNRRYRRKNRRRRAAYNRFWRMCNPDRAKLGTLRYKWRKQRRPVEFTEEHWQEALKYWGGRCAYCGTLGTESNPIERDHYIPVSDARPSNPGTVPGNIVPACRSCNATKHNKAPEEFLYSVYSRDEAAVILRKIRRFRRDAPLIRFYKKEGQGSWRRPNPQAKGV